MRSAVLRFPTLLHHLIRELKCHIGIINNSSLTLFSTQELIRHFQGHFLIERLQNPFKVH